MQHVIRLLQVVQGEATLSLELSDSQWRLRGISKTSCILTDMYRMEEGTGACEDSDQAIGTGANDILPSTRPERKRSVAMQEVIGFSKTAREMGQKRFWFLILMGSIEQSGYHRAFLQAVTV